MSLVHKLPVKPVGAETGVDMVIVSAGIAVIRAFRFIVKKQRGVPDGSGAKVGYIVQMVDDALDVPSVTAEELIAGRLLRRVRSGVIGRVTVGKSVRHYQIYHVCGRKTPPPGGTFSPGSYLIRTFEAFTIFREHQPVGSGSSIMADFNIDEEIIRAVRLVNIFYFYAMPAFNPDTAGGYLCPLHKKLQRGLHTRPPGKRLHPGHPIPGIRYGCRLKRSVAGAGCKSGDNSCRHNYILKHFKVNLAMFTKTPTSPMGKQSRSHLRNMSSLKNIPAYLLQKEETKRPHPGLDSRWL